MNHGKRFLTASAGVTLLICFGAASRGFARPQKTASASPLVEDKGRFVILVNGRGTGTEEFSMTREGDTWLAKGNTEIRAAGGTVRVAGRLKLAADGSPIQYDWSTQGGQKAAATVKFQGSKVMMTMNVGGKEPFQQEFEFASQPVVVLDNNLYDHYAILAQLYDWKRRGPQNFAVLIPQERTPGTVTAEALGTQNVDGRPLELLRIRTADLEVNLFLDAGHRLTRLVVPSSRAEVRRE